MFQQHQALEVGGAASSCVRRHQNPKLDEQLLKHFIKISIPIPKYARLYKHVFFETIQRFFKNMRVDSDINMVMSSSWDLTYQNSTNEAIQSGGL
jgi:hypothetical protein